MPGPPEILSGWPFAASLASALVARGLLSGRRRQALNEAMHELRRPLQALSLVSDGNGWEANPGLDSSLRMATAALERLDREINGGPAPAPRTRFAVRPLLEESVGRWRARAGAGGDALELRWRGPDAELDGDRGEIERALDNLIANALEHGGARVAVGVEVTAGRLRLAVVDRGGRRPAPLAARRRLDRRAGRSRRGHGLRIVRRAAVAHGGDFSLRRSRSTTEAVLELPLGSRAGRGA